MDEEKAISLGLLELFSAEQDKYNKKVFTRIKKIESLDDIGNIEDNTMYLLEEEKDDLYLIPNGSIGEEKLDAALRKKLEYLDTAVEELAAI